MIVTSRGIVLHALKYNDNTIICDILTESEGCIGFAVHISHSRQGGIRPALLQPLSLVETTWENHLRTTGLARLNSLSAVYPYVSLGSNPHKTAVGLFIAEFLRHALHGEPSSPALFEYIWQSLRWLDTCPTHFANFHLVFLLRLSRFLGFYPNVSKYQTGDFFDMENSTFCPLQPSHPHFLMPEDACHLPTLMRMKYENMHLFHLTGTQRSRLLRFATDYYRLHLPQFPELKSLPILQTIFL